MTKANSFLAAMATLAVIICGCGPEPVEVSSVSLDKTSLDIPIGGSATLTATVSPSNADDPSVSWSSSDEKTATVSQSGKVSAVALGTATITAKAGTKTATCKVVVSPVEVEKVELDKTELSLIEGESAKLSATVSPSDATDATITWTSSDEKTATVDGEGLVTAITVGEATITAKAGTKTATCKVKISPAPITAIAVEPSAFSLMEGLTKQLELSTTPATSTAPKGVDWVSDKPEIATVDDQGLVKALKPGQAKIWARLQSNHDIQSYSTVTVERDESLKDFSLNPARLEVQAGKTKQIEVNFIPEYAANKNITWKSADPSIATVDAQGNVTGVAVGKTAVTATSNEGNISRSCEISVLEAVPDIWFTMYQTGLFKNGQFVEGSPLQSDQVISSGEDIYVLTNSALFKNGTRLASFNYSGNPTDICVWNGKIYGLLWNDYGVYIFSTDSQGRTDTVYSAYANGYKKGRYYKLAVAPSGEIYALGYETDAFKEDVAVLLTVSKSGEISKKSLSGFYYNYFDIETDDDGNLFMVAADKDNRNLGLYKNGEFQYNIFSAPQSNVASQNVSIALHNGDVYVANDGNGSISIYRNKERLWHFPYDETARTRHHPDGNIVVAKNGDVYVAGHQSVDWKSTYSFVWKNGQPLYQIPYTFSILSLTIVE